MTNTQRAGYVVAIVMIVFAALWLGPRSAKADTAIVVATCGTPPTTYTAGQNRPTTMDVNGNLCSAATAGGGTSATNITQTGGNVLAADDAAAGTTVPLPVGGIYNNPTLPVYTAGDRTQLQTGDNGSVNVQVRDDTNNTLASIYTNGDALSNGGTVGLAVNNRSNLFNGSWDREFTCPNQATISVANTTAELVPLSASTVIRVCSFGLTDSLAGTVKFIDGTGSACATSPSDLTAAMVAPTNGFIGLSAGNGSLIRTRAGRALCLTSGTGTITGWVSYAQY